MGLVYFMHYYIDGEHFTEYTYDGIDYYKMYTIMSLMGKDSFNISDKLYEKEFEIYIQPYLRTAEYDSDKLNSLVEKYYQYDDDEDSCGEDQHGSKTSSSPLHFKYMDYALQNSVLGGVTGPFKVKVSENNNNKNMNNSYNDILIN